MTWADLRTRVKAARLARNLSYHRLTDEVDLSYPTVHRCLTDEAYVPYERTQHQFAVWLSKGGETSPIQWRKVKSR
ncbi:MAG: hypothetical protein WC655_23650 [Candidatus Hydrogenedentales bacterium]|jgi:hypothetical protein